MSEESLSNRYRIERQLGAGPDGVAYAATELAGGGPVEFHVIDKAYADNDRWQELSARMRIVKLLDHPASHRIEELLLDESPPAVACATLPPRTLHGQCELDLPAAISIAERLCDAVAAAHRLGLYHGNLSPKTIYLNDNAQVRLDFTGLRTGRHAEASRAGTLVSDMEQLGQVLQWLLIDQGPLSTVEIRLEGRNLAALKQLIRTAQRSEPAEPCTIGDLLACLARLREELPAGGRAADPNDGTIQEQVIAAAPRDGGDLEAGDTADTPVPAIDSEPIHDATAAEPVDMSAAAEAVAGVAGALREGSRLGRYRIETKLGEGGMGAVYRAQDLGSGNTVAVKVLNAAALSSDSAVRRFHKEARMLAKVNNPYVANLLEINEDHGRHFLVIEYVAGGTLKSKLRRRQPLPQRESLLIAADVARALADAHEIGVVHRDIKPDNIHVERISSEHEDAAYRVKLLDFGIAREIDQTESMALTRQGTLLGTPLYMSPEQCKGKGEVGPPSDVYSLGITLYEMLAGRPPFSASDPMKLAAMHCFEPPPNLRKSNPAVSDAVVEIIGKAIAKRPEDRYADAAHLLTDIDRLLRGDTASAEVHPRLPPHDAEKLFQLDLVWELEASAGQLWPYVSNTERLNRAVGLPSVAYRTEQDPKLGVRKFGSFRLGGMKIAWEEHPFEWVEGRRMGILREFDAGPFRWFLSIVELEPLATGGTRLHHRVRIAPRNTLGRLLARVEADWKGRRALDRIYRRIDQSLTGRLEQSIGHDPFEPPAPLSATRLRRLGQRTDRLTGRGVAPELAGKLSEYLATAPAQEVAKMRPVILADRLQAGQNETIEALLHASVEGLVTLVWDVLCPTCRAPADAKQTLQELGKHTYCEACDFDFLSNLANSVEMVFRVHPELRKADPGPYCIGGPEHARHVVAQLRLEAGERIELETQLTEGEYLVRGPRLPVNHALKVVGSGAPSRVEIRLAAGSDPRRTAAIRSGKQLIQIGNEFDHLQVVRLERTLPRRDLVTAAQASALPLFRKLFPQQVLGVGQLMSAEQVTLLVTEIENIDALYNELGDADAYSLVQHHLEIVERIVRDCGGAVVKIVGEGIEAAWHESSAAVRAALSLQEALDRDPEARRVQLSIGIHSGPVLVTTVNGRLDYFGATARAAASLPAHAQGGVVLTEAVYSDPKVTALIQHNHSPGTVHSTDLPGAPNSLMMRLLPP